MARAERQDDPPGVLELTTPIIRLVTGASGSGKTRYCEREIGPGAAGVLCPAVEVEGVRTGILARVLPGDETRRLAALRSPGDGGLVTPRWTFDEATVAWVDHHLAEIGECDRLIVDELGPLEFEPSRFERGEGFRSAFGLLDRGAFRVALVVVRPSLIKVALARWPQAEVVDVTR